MRIFGTINKSTYSITDWKIKTLRIAISVIFGASVFLWNIFTGYGHLLNPELAYEKFDLEFILPRGYYHLLNSIFVVGLCLLIWIIYQTIIFLKHILNKYEYELILVKTSALYAIVTIIFLYEGYFNFYSECMTEIIFIYEIYILFLVIVNQNPYISTYTDLKVQFYAAIQV